MCSISGCERKHYGGGLCSLHYQRRWRQGDPLTVLESKRPSTPTVERLRAKTRVGRADECWIYEGATTRSGHGMIYEGGTMRGAHCVAWEATNGSVPDGLVVRHTCDVPACVNPAHLVLGTVADNNRDRDVRGRHTPLPGVKNGTAKLDEASVREIRRLCGDGVPQSQIARTFGVHQGTISLINRRKIWGHVR